MNRKTSQIRDFDEALKVLNIEDYKSRIFNSNSHGELFHCYDYIHIANFMQKHDIVVHFRKLFEDAVKFAEKEWDNPSAVYQHMPKMIDERVAILLGMKKWFEEKKSNA